MEIIIDKIKVRLVSFVQDNEGNINWSLNTELITQANEVVSREILSNDALDETLKLDMPPEILAQAQNIFATATPLCNNRIADRHGGRRMN